MHRYWRDTFSEEYPPKSFKYKDQIFNKKSLIKAMDIVDEEIGYLYEIQEKRKGQLWIISALGQEAVNNELKLDTILESESKFRKILKVKKYFANK